MKIFVWIILAEIFMIYISYVFGGKVFFAWYDAWVGVYVDKKNRKLYACLIPMITVEIPFSTIREKKKGAKK